MITATWRVDQRSRTAAAAPGLGGRGPMRRPRSPRPPGAPRCAARCPRGSPPSTGSGCTRSAPADADRRTDLVDADVGVPAFGEERRRRVEDLVAPRRRRWVLLAWPDCAVVPATVAAPAVASRGRRVRRLLSTVSRVLCTAADPATDSSAQVSWERPNRRGEPGRPDSAGPLASLPIPDASGPSRWPARGAHRPIVAAQHGCAARPRGSARR